VIGWLMCSAVIGRCGYGRNLVDGKLSYRDFVWFLISEEDKRHPRRFLFCPSVGLFICLFSVCFLFV